MMAAGNRTARTLCLCAPSTLLRALSLSMGFVPLCLLLPPLAASGGEPPKTTPGGGSSGTAILNMTGYWRWHTALKPPQTVDGTGKLTALKPAIVNYSQAGDALESPVPPEDWISADFDDSLWPRSRLDSARDLAFAKFSANRACFRGKFAVTDPDSATLRLSFNYRGGVVVYVNGQELCRAHLPQGKLEAETPAEAYPDEAFVDKAGKPIPSPDKFKNAPAEQKKELEEGIAKRHRALAPVEIPAKLLRRGTNVLAIEIRRAHYHASAAGWFTPAGVGAGAPWVTAGLDAVKLEAGGAGATANTARPRGLHIWNQDRCDRVALTDYGDPNEPPRPLKIFGARNGTFCAQLALGSTEVLAGVSATPSALKGPKGEIAAAGVAVLYGLPDMAPYMQVPWFQSLTPKAPAQVAVHKNYGAAVQELLVRVKVPKDAAAGLYKGAVTVSASGKSFEVPLEVNVSDWALPDAKDYRTYIGAYQSPVSVAMQYNVQPWSEEHWKLMEKSFELLGRVGNKMINVSVVDETQFGEPEGMINWIKKGDPSAGSGSASYDYDFSVFDRYLALAMKHCGKLDYVCFQIWHAGGWEARPVDNKCTVTVRDEKGAKSMMQVPKWATPEAAAFWKPFFEKVQERLAKQGMDKALTIGILSCSTAPDAVFKTTAEVLPNGAARWQRGCHVQTDEAKPYNVSKGCTNLVSLHEHCYGMSMVSPQIEKLPAIHDFRGRPGTAYQRISSHEVTASLLSFKLMTENGIWCQKQGIGRICLDFWSVLKTKGGSDTGGFDIYNRYPHSSCAQREPSLKRLSWPGPDGAEVTVNYEAFAEGLQETEAGMVLSKAAAAEATVGKELADKCRAVLRERLMFCHARDICQWNRPFYHLDHYGWQDLARRSFDLAGEVSAKLGK
jgi:hypothetical protein